MAYIKFDLDSNVTEDKIDDGVISRLQRDRDDGKNNYDVNLIMHALSSLKKPTDKPVNSFPLGFPYDFERAEFAYDFLIDF